MPVVQHEIDIFDTSDERARSLQFLTYAQQQATQLGQAKIASLTFMARPISPWIVLSALGQPSERHAYYDSPQLLSMVGIGAAVAFGATGETRFSRSQDFINFWQRQFLYAEPVRYSCLSALSSPDSSVAHLSPARLSSVTDSVAELAPSATNWQTGHFFCSATFFAAAPSEPAEFEPAYVFVPKIQVQTSAALSRVTFNCLVSPTTDVSGSVDWMYERLRRLITAEPIRYRPVGYLSGRSIAKDVASFENAVTAALKQVNAQKLHKVVLADVMDVVVAQPVDVVRSLQALRRHHPDCTVFSVGNGRGQSFIGASPERLLNITQGQLTTEALAGTTSRAVNRGIDWQLGQTLLNSQKERYEHRVVVEFIVEQLRSLGLDPHYATTPQLLRLLHVQHLHTPISAALTTGPNTGPSVQPLDILAKLHPTPAVAGVPPQRACEFIRQHETFDRGLYTAPFGWIDTNGNSEFIVGIRSALIDGCKARLYAGAGIVAGSEPAKELAEIKLKLQTLLNALI